MNSQKISTENIAEYIASILASLQDLSAKNDLQMLHYLLEMAEEQALNDAGKSFYTDEAAEHSTEKSA